MSKKQVYIIAEIGVNHNGDIKIAKDLIDVAKNSGADAVKFQMFSADSLVTQNAPKAKYQRKNSDNKESQFDMLKRLELTEADFINLYEYCNKKEIDFLATAFDMESLDFLYQMGLKQFKIPSGEITNLPYLEHIALFKKKIILSTGMSDYKEILFATKTLNQFGISPDMVTILHCNTAYPTPLSDANILAIKSLKMDFKNHKIGFSDHTSDIYAGLGAVALGAVVIEKHITLNKELYGPDHLASCTPKDFERYVNGIRAVELALGNGKKIPQPSELENKIIARKSIVASTRIRKGDIFNLNNITVKRPGNGISPINWHNVLGKISNRDYEKDELIKIPTIANQE